MVLYCHRGWMLTIIMNDFKDITVAVADTVYVGLSIATLLSQHHHVPSVDVIPEKVENKISPIQDGYIEKYLAKSHILVTQSDALVINTASAPYFHKMRLVTPN